MTTPTAVERVNDDVFSDLELRTLAEFLGGYSSLTREAYALDLRASSRSHDLRIALFAVTRPRPRLEFVACVERAQGVRGKRVGLHTLQHAFITAALDAGVALRDV